MRHIILIIIFLLGCENPTKKSQNSLPLEISIPASIPTCLSSIESYNTEKSLIQYLRKTASKNPTYLDEDVFLIPCDDLANWRAIIYEGKNIILYDELLTLVTEKLVETSKQYDNIWNHPLLMFFIFHEQGHIKFKHGRIEGGRLITKGIDKKKKLELELVADNYSLNIMFQKGYTDTELIDYYSKFYNNLIQNKNLIGNLKIENDSHPSFEDRIQNIRKTFIAYKNENQ